MTSDEITSLPNSRQFHESGTIADAIRIEIEVETIEGRLCLTRANSEEAK
jgi:hypothetical protein